MLLIVRLYYLTFNYVINLNFAFISILFLNVLMHNLNWTPSLSLPRWNPTMLNVVCKQSSFTWTFYIIVVPTYHMFIYCWYACPNIEEAQTFEAFKSFVVARNTCTNCLRNFAMLIIYNQFSNEVIQHQLIEYLNYIYDFCCTAQIKLIHSQTSEKIPSLDRAIVFGMPSRACVQRETMIFQYLLFMFMYVSLLNCEFVVLWCWTKKKNIV